MDGLMTCWGGKLATSVQLQSLFRKVVCCLYIRLYRLNNKMPSRSVFFRIFLLSTPDSSEYLEIKSEFNWIQNRVDLMAFLEVFGLLFVVSLYCGYCFLTNDFDFDELRVADIASSSRLDILPLHLGLLRFAFGIVIWSTMTFLLVDREGLKITVLCRGENDSV